MVNKPFGERGTPLFSAGLDGKFRNDSDIADQAYELGDKVDNFVDERPLTALAIAVVVGALLARQFFSSPAEGSTDHSAIGPDGRATDFLENLRRRIA